MTRYIDADALLEEQGNLVCAGLRNGKTILHACKNYLKAVIDHAPTADVVEVVRCRDCEWRYTDECPMHFEEECWHEERWYDDDGWAGICYIPHDFTHDDGFCDKWERRKEDGTSF